MLKRDPAAKATPLVPPAPTIRRVLGDVVADELDPSWTPPDATATVATMPPPPSGHMARYRPGQGLSVPPPVASPLPPPPPPVSLPDGDPAAGALAILAAVRPDAADALRQRIATIEAELAQHLGRARLDDVGPNAVTLRSFAQRVANRIRLRNVLEARLATLDSTAAPDRPAVAVEVADLTRRVKRWKAGDELRQQRTEIATKATRELGEVEAQLQVVAQRTQEGRPLGVDRGIQCPHCLKRLPGAVDHATTGQSEPQDEALRQLSSLLTRRRELQRTLASIGEDIGARSEAARIAVNAVSREAVLNVLVPAQSVPEGSVLALRHALSDLDARIQRTDDETETYAALVERRAKLEGDLERAIEAVDRERQTRAARLLDSALGGDLPSIASLETIVRPALPTLARDLANTRGSDLHLIGVVSQLIGPD